MPKNPPLEITIATSENSGMISALHCRCFEIGWSEKSISETMKSPGCATLIAKSEGHEVGFIIYRVITDECEIITTGIIPEARKHGYATELLKKAIKEAESSGAKKIFLEVEEDNIAAQKLYAKCGFVITGKRKNYYTIGNFQKDAILMERISPL